MQKKTATTSSYREEETEGYTKKPETDSKKAVPGEKGRSKKQKKRKPNPRGTQEKKAHGHVQGLFAKKKKKRLGELPALANKKLEQRRESHRGEGPRTGQLEKGEATVSQRRWK